MMEIYVADNGAGTARVTVVFPESDLRASVLLGPDDRLFLAETLRKAADQLEAEG